MENPSIQTSRRPLISIVIPTYNRGDTIIAAVESALSQTYENREVLVIDDGSKDDTGERLEPYLDRIQYHYQENKGKSAAMNYALGISKGNWFAILDSDDLWMPEKLELQIEAFERCHWQAGLCFSDGIYMGNPQLAPEVVGTFFQQSNKSFSDEYGCIEDSLNHVLHPPHGIFGQTTIIRKDLLIEAGGFDEELIIAEDTDALFRVALLTSFAYVNRPLVKVDRTPRRKEGLAEFYQKVTPQAVRCRKHMYKKWLEMDAPLSIYQRRLIQRRLSSVYQDEAVCNLSKGNYNQAIVAFDNALNLYWKWNYFIKKWLTRFLPFVAGKILTRST